MSRRFRRPRREQEETLPRTIAPNAGIPTSPRGRRVSFIFGIVAGVAVSLAGVFVWQRMSSGSVTANDQSPARAAQDAPPGSYQNLLAMSPERLGKADLALVNLLCAQGLPGAEKLDIPAALKKLDEWAARVKAETERHLYRLQDPNYADHYARSEARLRSEFIVQTLQEECGVHYNEARINEPEWHNSLDHFLHGMIGSDNGGTCASMPVMYAVIGRRLGYPIKLASAKGHLFCRWEDARERLNFDGSANGGIDFPDDAYYRQWPSPISDEEMASGQYLRSMTPQAELATFLLQRGTILQALDRWPEALAVFAEAHQLAPNEPSVWAALQQAFLHAGQGLGAAGVPTDSRPGRSPGGRPRTMNEADLPDAVRPGMPPAPTPHIPTPYDPLPTIPFPPPPTPPNGQGKPQTRAMLGGRILARWGTEIHEGDIHATETGGHHRARGLGRSAAGRNGGGVLHAPDRAVYQPGPDWRTWRDQST